MQVQRIIHTQINCIDLEKSIDFYTRVLGGTLVSRTESGDSAFLDAMGMTGNHAFRAAFIGFPKQKNFPVLDLLQWEDPGEMGPPPGMKDRGIPRMAMEVDDVHRAYEELLAEGADVLGPPTELGVTTLKMTAFKVRDPNGILIELLTFIR